jgi:hypothetical protein
MNRRKFLQTVGITLGALALPAVAAQRAIAAGVRSGKTANTHASMYAWIDDELTPRGDKVGYIEVDEEKIYVHHDPDGGILFIRG